MSFSSTTFEIEELIDMSKEIITLLKNEDRLDLVALFRDMMKKYDLEYETESSVSSEEYAENEVVPEKVVVEYKDGFMAIKMDE